MANLSDDDLFTLPLTFMGVPYGTAGPVQSRGDPGVALRLRHASLPGRGAQRSGRRAAAIGLDPPLQPDARRLRPVAALDVVDCGNVKLTPGRILDAFERIEQATTCIVDSGAVPVSIGGDGSITVPVMRAVAKRHKNLVALHIDSHTDAYAYDPADKYNAATQFTHVAEEGLLDVSASWHVGIRGTTFGTASCRARKGLATVSCRWTTWCAAGSDNAWRSSGTRPRDAPSTSASIWTCLIPRVRRGFVRRPGAGLSAREGID